MKKIEIGWKMRNKIETGWTSSNSFPGKTLLYPQL
jgi:hypothetical protein